MSSNTPNLGLLKKDPITDGNETFNIQTMLNDNWDKIDEAVGKVEEGLNNISIPDASLTQKGITQLSNATNSTSETLAATSKAVKAAVDGAIPKLIPDTRNVPTKPSDYSKNVAYSFKTGSVIGLSAEQFVILHGFKGWNDDSGGVTHEYASGGTTGSMYHRTGTSANDAWGPWMQIIDNGVPWQKRKLTEDNGHSINISNGNANNLVAAGFYVGENIAHAPTTAAGAWWYIEVQAMSADSWVIQKAYDLFSPGSFRMRIKSNGTWTAWSEDLFTSVANGKSSIATAISGKGVPTSPTDPFATMAANIGMINTGIKSTQVVSPNGGQSYATIGNLGFTPKILLLNVTMRVQGDYGPLFGESNTYLIAYNVDGNLFTDSYSSHGLGIYNTDFGGLYGSMNWSPDGGITFGANSVNYSLMILTRVYSYSVNVAYIFGV